MKKLFHKMLLAALPAAFIFSSSLQAKPSVHSVATQNTSKGAAPQAKQSGAAQKQNGAKWQEYTSEESGFKVNFPTKPDHIQQSIEVPHTNLKIHYDTYVSEPNESSVYVVSVWHYPAEIDMSHPEVNLQDGFNGMLSALPGSKVLKMEMGKQQDFKALEFLVKNEDIYFQGKLILVHNTLFQVFTVYRDNVDMTNNYNNFIDSFKLTNTDKHKVKPAGTGKKVNVKLS